MDQSIDKSEEEGMGESCGSNRRLGTELGGPDSMALQHLINENNMLKRLLSRQAHQQLHLQLSPSGQAIPTMPSLVSPSKCTEENTSFFNFTSIKNDNSRDEAVKVSEAIQREGGNLPGSKRTGFMPEPRGEVGGKPLENESGGKLMEYTVSRLGMAPGRPSRGQLGAGMAAVKSQLLSAERTGKESCMSLDLGSYVYHPAGRRENREDDSGEGETVRVDFQYLVR